MQAPDRPGAAIVRLRGRVLYREECLEVPVPQPTTIRFELNRNRCPISGCTYGVEALAGREFPTPVAVIKLRIIRPGQPDEIVEVEGNRAVIGRASDCDIVVNEEYVSGRHLMVLSGFVVVDLDSTNGTFIDGARLGEATVVGRREFQMGNEKTDARIELIEASADLVPQDANAAHLELLQERDALLREVESLRAQLREREESQGTDESSDGHRDSEASGDGPGEGRIISLFERLVRQRNSEDGPDAVERGSSRRSLGSSSTRL